MLELLGIHKTDDKTRRIASREGRQEHRRHTAAEPLPSTSTTDKGRVVVLGNASAIDAARVLIESHVATMADLATAADDSTAPRRDPEPERRLGEEEELSSPQGRRVRRDGGRGEGVP